MIVTLENFEAALCTLQGENALPLDTETTGLRPYHGDKIFSIILAGKTESYYFNFQKYRREETPVLGASHIAALKILFDDPDKIWIMHNAKFDMAMLEQCWGVEIRGRVYCTMAMERLVDSVSSGRVWSLGHIAKKYGMFKDKSVEEFIKEHKLYTKISVPGKKKEEVRMHFDKVPFRIIAPYGETDARIAHTIAARQREKMIEIDLASPGDWPRLDNIYRNEMKLLRTVYDMEKIGVKVDRDFCAEAISHEKKEMQNAERIWYRQTKIPYKESPKAFASVFTDEKWEYTDKGNPSFASEVLEHFSSPLARAILAHRKAKANINYYLGFLHTADTDGIIHTNFNQHVARTGRFSSSNPNLQNMKKEDEDEKKCTDKYTVRRAIVPRPGNFLGMLDYDQMEYRLMVDYAGATKLVRMIIDEGLDVHSATALIAGISRKQAKTVNFGIIYGQGMASLGESLGVSEAAAKEIRDKIFKNIPEVEILTESVKRLADRRGYIFNWLGRRTEFPRNVQGKKTNFKATNSLIQGGAADVVKVAMNECAEFLAAGHYKTRLVMQIHDELVFEGPKEEIDVLPKLKSIMENVYPHRHLPLTCGIDVSFRSLADKITYEQAVREYGLLRTV